ncbi:Avidin family [Legionella lansingensis]|uniref:Avidin family protein n=1 Tax=Legionella lansingensis TaxID=45067 RepID=A0A0W0VLG9_9GAMM|nr:avidin/streptavidin family protein [Legionella lansingensis]KTD20931.1 Avidin family protein [Legionella lansingensis]SNV44353.1 Avidin family [Legionella lansingensis]
MGVRTVSRYLALGGLIVLSQSGLAAEDKMVFKNEKGSVLELVKSQEGALTGSFTTAVASKECQQAVGQKRPIVGYLTGNAFTISIDYPDCGSALSIIGNLSQDNKTLDTTWVVAHQAPATRKDLSARFIGHNTYTRVTM